MINNSDNKCDDNVNDDNNMTTTDYETRKHAETS